MDINRLLKPKKVAIVGASERDNMGGFVTENFLKHSQSRMDDVYFINLSSDYVRGVKCYKSISDLPEKVDLAVICTPKHTILDLIDECGQNNVGGAVVFASGFAETGKAEDIELEEKLIEKAKELGVALMGPNCAGFINNIEDLYSFGFLLEGSKNKGRIGLISQSGQICMALMDSQKGNYSYLISSGNSSVVSIEEYMGFLLEDENTDVLAVYVEGIKNPQKFLEVLKKANEINKPVVILKVGRSPEGSKVAGSHTGSMVGDDGVIDAVLKKYGALRVDDLEEMISLCESLVTLGDVDIENKICFINISGGEAAISADMSYLHGLKLSSFSPSLTKKLEEILPSFATAQNPLDLTGGSDGNTMREVCEAVFDSGEIDLVVSSLQIVNDIKDTTIYDYAQGFIDYKKENPDKAIFIVPLIEDKREDELLSNLKEVGIPVLAPPNYGYKVINKIIERTNYKKKLAFLSLENHCHELGFETEDPLYLSERQAKKVLANSGISVPKEGLAKNKEEALGLANEIGYPLVLKVDSNEIAHKTEVGGVLLNIRNDEELIEGFNQIEKNLKERAAGKEYNGILIQEMLTKGFEVIVGIKNDPQFGPMVLLGIGGTIAELVNDAVVYPASLNKTEALEMIRSLKSRDLFFGFRGSENLDVAALTDLLVKVSNLSVKHKEDLIELDINPVFLYEENQGLAIADALILANKEGSLSKI